jgi:hypothetical protein
MMRRYRLTALGELEEEDYRRPWRMKVLDELRRPPRVVDLLYLVVGVAIALLVQFAAHRLGWSVP